jgi:hypothetical protein
MACNDSNIYIHQDLIQYESRDFLLVIAAFFIYIFLYFHGCGPVACHSLKNQNFRPAHPETERLLPSPQPISAFDLPPISAREALI